MPVLTLVGGPFDGDTMRFRPDQHTIVAPESADGTIHEYRVCADGKARYHRAALAAPVPDPKENDDEPRD